MDGTKLDEADFYKAIMTELEMNMGIRFTTTRLEETSITLRLPPHGVTPDGWTQDLLRTALDHRYNYGKSLLKTINSISNRYPLKTQLMRDVIASIKRSGEDLDDIKMSLFEALSHRIYRDDPALNSMLEDAGHYYVQSLNTKASITLQHQHKTIEALADYFVGHPEQITREPYAFIQTLTYARLLEETHPDLVAKLRNQYEKSYLMDEKFAPFTQARQFGKGKIPDWRNKKAWNLILPSNDDPNACILLSEDRLMKMLNLDPKRAWNSLLYRVANNGWSLEGPSSPHPEDLSTIHLPILKPNYLYSKNLDRVKEFLKTLKLGPYQADFFSALEKRRSDKKWMTDKDNSNLATIFQTKYFSDLVSPSTSDHINALKEEHLGEILSAFEITDTPDAKKAEYLLSLSAFFVKSASSRFFGEKNLPPAALRDYAYALMREAYILHPDLFKYNNIDLFCGFKTLLFETDKDADRRSQLFARMANLLEVKSPDVSRSIIPPDFEMM
jgi:hypothetical protein